MLTKAIEIAVPGPPRRTAERARVTRADLDALVLEGNAAPANWNGP